MIKASQYRPAAPIDPLTLSTGADGFFYNCQSLANMRQDNIDTPAAVGQPVGMFFDSWVTNTLGADLVTNGDFPTATTGWTAGNSGTLSIVSARLRVTNGGAAAGRAFQSITTVVGATYKVTVDLVTNANGAQIAVGSTNANTALFALSLAAGVTGSYTFYFIATGTASFISLRTNTTTAGHFVEYDNVVAKNIAGRHLIQQTSTARPILRQDALGHYYLEPDGVDDFLNGGLSYTIQSNDYIACIVRRMDSSSAVMFGAYKNGNSYHRISSTSGWAMQGQLRETTLGPSNAVGVTNASVVGRLIPCDSLAVDGTTDFAQNRRVPVTAANSWSGTVLTLCTPTINANGTATAAATVTHFYAGLGMAQDPGASRAGIRAYLANLAGAD